MSPEALVAERQKALGEALGPNITGVNVTRDSFGATFGVLRGAGDTRWPAMINLLGYWIIGIPLGYWFGVHLYQDPRYVWGGVAVALAFISALVVARMVWVMKRGATIVQNEE